jgi:hypothetical protein
MAQARGYSCDGPDCSTFEVGPAGGNLPAGWLVVNVVTHQDHAPGVFELCSNRCMKRLAERRIQADKESTPIRPKEEVVQAPPKAKPKGPVVGSTKGKAGRVYSPEGRRAMQVNGMILQHNKGNHANFVNPDCPKCDEDTRASTG